MQDLLLNVSYSTCENIIKELRLHHRSNTNMNSFRQNIVKFSCHMFCCDQQHQLMDWYCHMGWSIGQL